MKWPTYDQSLCFHASNQSETDSIIGWHPGIDKNITKSQIIKKPGNLKLPGFAFTNPIF